MSKAQIKLFAVFCLVATLAIGISSSLYSIKLWMSFDKSWFQYALMIVAISCDFGKYAFPAVSAIKYSKEKYISAIGYALLGLICIVISYYASMGYDLNKANKIMNEAVISSDTYQKQSKVFDTTSNSIEELKADIKQMKTNRKADEQKIRNDYAPLISNARRLNMLTIHKDSVAEITKRMNADIKALDTAIANKESQLETKENGLTTTSKDIAQTAGTKDIRTTEGIYALAVYLDKENPEEMLGTLFKIKNVLLEVIGIAFSLAFGFLIGLLRQPKEESEHESLNDRKSNIKKSYHDNDAVTAKSNHKIGFCMTDDVKSHDDNSNDNVIDNEFKEIYYKYLCKNVDKNNQVPGYGKAARYFDIKSKKAYAYHNVLADEGRLMTKGKYTYLNKEDK